MAHRLAKRSFLPSLLNPDFSNSQDDLVPAVPAHPTGVPVDSPFTVPGAFHGERRAWRWEDATLGVAAHRNFGEIHKLLASTFGVEQARYLTQQLYQSFSISPGIPEAFPIVQGVLDPHARILGGNVFPLTSLIASWLLRYAVDARSLRIAHTHYPSSSLEHLSINDDILGQERLSGTQLSYLAPESDTRLTQNIIRPWSSISRPQSVMIPGQIHSSQERLPGSSTPPGKSDSQLRATISLPQKTSHGHGPEPPPLLAVELDSAEQPEIGGQGEPMDGEKQPQTPGDYAGHPDGVEVSGFPESSPVTYTSMIAPLRPEDNGLPQNLHVTAGSSFDPPDITASTRSTAALVPCPRRKAALKNPLPQGDDSFATDNSGNVSEYLPPGHTREFVMINGRPEWEIEAIVGERAREGTGETEYEVKWKGYGNEHNEWKTESQLNRGQQIWVGKDNPSESRHAARVASCSQTRSSTWPDLAFPPTTRRGESSTETGGQPIPLKRRPFCTGPRRPELSDRDGFKNVSNLSQERVPTHAVEPVGSHLNTDIKPRMQSAQAKTRDENNRAPFATFSAEFYTLLFLIIIPVSTYPSSRGVEGGDVISLSAVVLLPGISSRTLGARQGANYGDMMN
ncbi:hypothetical protein FB45DRAFT_863395 [Roridomyces roridus]|uniref:Chromo domain-containing protein n=1 Tax=Roridomyces roridus TaxID=1738132 RepID=A0AAD7C3N4_9AGAR|nr:hypothetical protein FB45DRAFT_863395 [Roridomyces roridus]